MFKPLTGDPKNRTNLQKPDWWCETSHQKQLVISQIAVWVCLKIGYPPKKTRVDQIIISVHMRIAS